MIAVVIALICLSGRELWKMSEKYVHEAHIKSIVSKYRPANMPGIPETQQSKPQNTESAGFIITGEGPSRQAAQPVLNDFIINLQNEINSDITGWIAVPDTNIDYPFVTAGDNDYYLRRDIFGNYALAGTLFTDYRCPADFTGFNTIIYGHNMKNGGMFGDLGMFGDEGFFESNRSGTIFLKDKTLALEFFAYMVIKSDDGVIYSQYYAETQEGREMDGFFEYVKIYARNYREPDKSGRVATLSTCSADGTERIVLIANIK